MSGETLLKTELAVSDIQLGAVELKDRNTDDRVTVKDISSYLGEPPGTTYGLFVGGVLALVSSVPLDINSLPPVDLSANVSFHTGVPVVELGGYFSTVYNTIDAEGQILSMGTISPMNAIMSKFTVALKCTHATNGVSYRITNFFGLLELDISSGNLNPGQYTIIEVNRPLLGITVYAKNKNTGSNSQITATLIGRV